VPKTESSFVSSLLESSKRPKRSAQLKQLGSQSTSYNRARFLVDLRNYEEIAYLDTVVHAALTINTSCVVAAIGDITHPDQEIAEFLKYNIAYIEDQYNTSWESIVSDLYFTSRWAGYSFAENLYATASNKLLLDGISSYHPKTVAIYPDKKGRLIDDKDTDYPDRKSGIYQASSFMGKEVHIPRWKSIFISNNSTFGNYYGRSDIEAIVKWHRLKESLIEMMAVALDRFASPLYYAIAPDYPTTRTKIDPATGGETQVTTHEILEEQIQNIVATERAFLLLSQQDNTNKPSLGSLSPSNNPGDIYLRAIQYCNEQIVLNLTVPFFLIQNEQINTEETTERRMEVFYNITEAYRKKYILPIFRQAFSKVIKYNFTGRAALEPPSFNKSYSDRPEDRVATMQMVKGMTELGYFNPKNEQDFEMVRQMVRAVARELKGEDKKFIDNVLLAMHQIEAKKEIAESGNSEKAEEIKNNNKRTNGGTNSNQINVKQQGRPTGSTSPIDIAKPQTLKRPKGDVA
jgi:hypothetical protein